MKISTLSLLTLLFFLIMSLFFYLQPKITMVLFKEKRVISLHEFLDTIEDQKNINVKSYWQFREFYSPGYFVYNKEGLNEDINPLILSLKKFDNSLKPQLFFNSKRIVSIGGKTKINFIPDNYILKEKPILQNQTTILYKNKTSIFIVFIKPIKEMKQANGFLQNFQDNDDLGSNWIELTKININ